MKVILLNGPPGSGKDTVASIISTLHTPCVLEKFARPLKELPDHIYDLPEGHFEDVLDRQGTKDEPIASLFHQTPRNVQIAISETLLKPLHGGGVFGSMFVQRAEDIDGNDMLFTVSDCGFRPEAEAVVDNFSPDNVELWTINRPGTDFSNDSRGYVTLADLGVQERQIDNSGSTEDLKQEVKKHFWRTQKHWRL